MAGKPRVCVLRAPGTNCDHETAFAFESCGAEAERLHLFRLLENPDVLAEFQIVCIPGGFSYGDDVGAGVIFAQQLQHRLVGALQEFLQRDTLLLGICNGFQVLLRSGLLPNGTEEWPPETRSPRPATLTWNDNGRYTAIWVHLQVHSPENVFLRGIDRIELPIAHGEGKFEVGNTNIFAEWHAKRQIAVCYAQPIVNGGATQSPRVASQSPRVASQSPRVASQSPRVASRGLTFSLEALPFPVNPNGSTANIAGLSDPTGRVLGLMPHPERFLHATQHPQWTRHRYSGEGEGMRLFRNAVSYFL